MTCFAPLQSVAVYLLLLISQLWIAHACTQRTYPNITAQLMPAEGSLHERTWMAYGATISAWGNDTNIPEDRDFSNSRPVARHDLMRLAAQLSRFEPVNMLVDSEEDKIEAEQWLTTIISQTYQVDKISKNANIDSSGNIYIGPNRKEGDLPPIRKYPINLIIQPINDLWTRDTAPLFVKNEVGIVSGVNFNFNGWGQSQSAACLPGWVKENKPNIRNQDIESDAKVAAFINNWLNIKEINTWLTIEGGGIEVNGRGLAVAAESCIFNNNRNPGKTKSEVESELKRVLGITKIMWIPGNKGLDITDGHIDFNARFASINHMVYTFDPSYDLVNEAIFKKAVEEVNSMSPELKLVYLGAVDAVLVITPLPVTNVVLAKAAIDKRNPNPQITTRPDFATSFAAGHIGYYEGNGCIIFGQFGDVAADQKAFNIIQSLYPTKVVIQITTDGVANGGGSIHCSTQQQMPILSNTTNKNSASSIALISFVCAFTIVRFFAGLLNVF